MKSLIKILFSLVWRKRLWDCKKLIKVTGWRSCLMDTKCDRKRVTFLFSGHKKLAQFDGIFRDMDTSNKQDNPDNTLNDTSVIGMR